MAHTRVKITERFSLSLLCLSVFLSPKYSLCTLAGALHARNATRVWIAAVSLTTRDLSFARVATVKASALRALASEMAPRTLDRLIDIGLHDFLN